MLCSRVISLKYKFDHVTPCLKSFNGYSFFAEYEINLFSTINIVTAFLFSSLLPLKYEHVPTTLSYLALSQAP